VFKQYGSLAHFFQRLHSTTTLLLVLAATPPGALPTTFPGLGFSQLLMPSTATFSDALQSPFLQALASFAAMRLRSLLQALAKALEYSQVELKILTGAANLSSARDDASAQVFCHVCCPIRRPLLFCPCLCSLVLHFTFSNLVELMGFSPIGFQITYRGIRNG
jgi:hypothetical protein